MAASRGATALLVCLLLLSIAAAGVGTVAATPDDTIDDDVDENTTTDTGDTTDTVTNTTDTSETVDNTSDPVDNTTDTVDDTTDDTTDTVENTTDTTNTTASDTVDDSTDTTTETTNTTRDTVEKTTNTTGDTIENTTNATDTLDNATGTLDNATGTLDGTSEALSGTLSGTTDTTVTGLLETTSTTVLASDSVVSEREGSGSESATDGTASDSRDWTRERDQAASGSVVAADTASAGTEPVSQTEPDATPRHLPLPDGTAATTAFVAGLVAIARPPVVTWGGASQIGTVATNHATAGFDRLRRFLVPLRYSRYDDSDPLDHEARAALYDAIESKPGVYLSDLSERADVNISTARHHVRVLEDEGLVTSAKPHGKRRYYPAAADDHELAAALSEPATAAVLEALADLETAHVGLLADELDRDPSTVSHHLQRLADDGLVVRERDGRAVVNRLADPVADALTDGPTHGPAVADD